MRCAMQSDSLLASLNTSLSGCLSPWLLVPHCISTIAVFIVSKLHVYYLCCCRVSVCLSMCTISVGYMCTISVAVSKMGHISLPLGWLHVYYLQMGRISLPLGWLHVYYLCCCLKDGPHLATSRLVTCVLSLLQQCLKDISLPLSRPVSHVIVVFVGSSKLLNRLISTD